MGAHIKGMPFSCQYLFLVSAMASLEYGLPTLQVSYGLSSVSSLNKGNPVIWREHCIMKCLWSVAI